MDSSRVRAPLPCPPEEDVRDEKVYGNVFAELESVDLPLGTTLRYSSISLVYYFHEINDICILFYIMTDFAFIRPIPHGADRSRIIHLSCWEN